MFIQILCIAAVLVAADGSADGEIIILRSPDSLDFKGTDEIDQSSWSDVFCSALGFTAKERNWGGMSILNPFELPEAVVSIVVEGVRTLHSPIGKRFPLNVDEGEETTWQSLSGRIEERDNSNTLMRLYLGDGFDALGQSTMGELKPTPIDESLLKSLSLKNKADYEFLEEMQLLNGITAKARTTIIPDGKADVYWLVLSSLSAVLKYHGEDSPAAKEAFDIQNESIKELTKAFTDVYNGKVLVTAFTNDASYVRHRRAAEATSRVDNVTSSDIKISKAYDENYPVMFNIFLWFGVAFVFSLIAVCITIGDMDPGRDSIIYRMTSNRMKKDN